MITDKEKKACRFLLFGYKKKLKKYVSHNTSLSASDIIKEYEKRFYKYMNESDMGNKRCKFISYLNIFSGLAAYEVLREKGLTETEGVAAYDSMCAFGVLKHHSRFIRKSTIAENGTVCHDTIEKVTKKNFL